MSREEILIATGGAVALVLFALVVLAFVRTARLRNEVGELRVELERRTMTPSTEAPVQDEATYVITGFSGPRASQRPQPEAAPARVAEHIDGRLFADIVARESVVKAGGLLHGLRRALDPETRNRIRFEMRRELKRSRRQRRSDLKAAMRDFQARERAGQASPDEEDAA